MASVTEGFWRGIGLAVVVVGLVGLVALAVVGSAMLWLLALELITGLELHLTLRSMAGMLLLWALIWLWAKVVN